MTSTRKSRSEVGVLGLTPLAPCLCEGKVVKQSDEGICKLILVTILVR